MERRNIIVIGASAGGFEPLKQLVCDLPADLDASIFIVWHISPEVTGVLPHVLNKCKTIISGNAQNMEPIHSNRIYVAPPDRHLILDEGFIRVTRGPKENRFRPAVDPLFRSAALVYGSRVIGIILSGALDDGTVGLWAIKAQGGIAIVQDPEEAEVPSMPENAIKQVKVDYTLKISEMAGVITKLISEEVITSNADLMPDHNRTKLEVQIAVQEDTGPREIIKFGEFSAYTCPECHGVLSLLREGERVRFRCHTGHAYSADSLLSTITENVENSLWDAIRSVEESILLLNQLGDHYAEHNNPKLASLYFKKAKDAQTRAQLVREAVLTHERITAHSINEQVESEISNELQN